MRADAGAAAVYTHLCDAHRFLATLLLHRDVLPLMTRLSKTLQARPPQFKTLMVMAPNIMTQIEQMIDEPGPQQVGQRPAITEDRTQYPVQRTITS